MTDISNYAENKIIDAVWRGQSLGAAATWYFALFTTAPNKETGSGGTECSGTGYARVGVAASTTNFSGTQSAGSTAVSSGTGGRTSNNAQIDFPTGAADWGTIVAIGIFDASTSGNMWFSDDLTASKTIGAGDPVYIVADAFGFTLT